MPTEIIRLAVDLDFGTFLAEQGKPVTGLSPCPKGINPTTAAATLAVGVLVYVFQTEGQTGKGPACIRIGQTMSGLSARTCSWSPQDDIYTTKSYVEGSAEACLPEQLVIITVGRNLIKVYHPAIWQMERASRG